ncbi:LTA synthase family protein [uncultured Polaribacter sp.]|uniref:LTA synthase family protein n=1 Tax=uncultured Polaribacter sp. TaxID=174711 RepID=UPI00262EF540|nr:alkaline phosphatase family protein [uncultured Polaribacter sp.]
MKNLKNKLLFNCFYFLLWIGYFVFARLFFLLFYFDKTTELNVTTFVNTFVYGLRLDISFTAYLSFIPFILISLTFFIQPKKITTIIIRYSQLLIAFLSLLLIIDATLYASWGTRLDATFLNYLNTPAVMIASATTFQLISGVCIWLLISYVFIQLFTKQIHKNSLYLTQSHWSHTSVLFLASALLIVPLRGGLQTIPVNQSNVYFSSNMFANHAAINYIWNFFNAITHSSNSKNNYVHFDEITAENIINKTKNKLLIANTDQILNTEKPNIILIIWESLTAKVVGVLDGEPTVTANLNELSKEGLLFTNFYANGDRTDKGIPAILSGYYPQPTKSIMKMPNKTRSLPMLPKKMNDLGYKTSFYYGGDLNFGNMNTYLRNAGIIDFVDGNEFDKQDWNSKWGVHDHVFMQRFLEDINKEKNTPFFKIALTLTSHEPFEFPDTYKFGKNTEENKFRSAHAYTDKAIGNFIADAKKQPWYKNTLIVIVSDHGHRTPEHEGLFNSPKKFKIPMLWLGGALQKKGIVNNISSQVDLSYTLLSILKGNNSDFKFGKNIFNNSQDQYAHYVFNNGFGLVTKNNTFVFDNIQKKPILTTGNNIKQLDSLSKAVMQNAYQDFLDRK